MRPGILNIYAVADFFLLMYILCIPYCKESNGMYVHRDLLLHSEFKGCRSILNDAECFKGAGKGCINASLHAEAPRLLQIDDNSESRSDRTTYPESFVPSRYNHFFEYAGKHLAINLLTNAVLSLDGDQYRLVRRILDFPMNQSPSQSMLSRLLVESKFLVPHGFDERAYLARLFETSKAGKKGLSLAFVITLTCNFRCPYCYQDHTEVRMERDVQDAVLAFLKRKLRGKEEFHAAWWGGEPLLEPQIIDSFGSEIIQLCESLDVQYDASITTNGYLLNEDNVRLLAKGRVKHVQVTLDGPREFHDKRRYLTNGHGSYDTILQNLYGLVQALPGVEVTIRCNIGRGAVKAEQWRQLLTDLAPVKSSISMALAQVAPARSFNRLCVSNEEFHAFCGDLTKMIQEQGFRITYGRKTPGAVFCGAIPVENWMVHPRGYLSKCTADVSTADGCLGRLNPSGTIDLNSDSTEWIDFSPFSLEKCTECDVLPLCMGGCPKISFDGPLLDRCRVKRDLFPFVMDFLTQRMRESDL